MATARRENLERYYPFQLSHRQKVFKDLDEYEAFYGGAAGGGKTDALIAAAVEFVHVAGYRALILRRTKENLADLIERTHEWWHGKAQWSGSRKRWLFPGGGRIYLGGMQLEKDKFKYKGPAFQYIGWDELTEFLKSQYEYLFSRVRKPKCQFHAQPDMTCQICNRVAQFQYVPLRVRAASNPDGEGREWVKSRFVSNQAADEICTGNYKTLYRSELGIAFVPSRVEDNPGMDAEEYKANSLSRLDPVTRARLAVGDWKVRPDGLIKQEWLRYYDTRDQILRPLGQDGQQIGTIDCRELHRFATIDTAGTSEEKAKEKKGKNPSWSVVQIWDYWAAPQWLFLRHVWRRRVNWDDLKAGSRSTLESWRPQKVMIENAHHGPPLASELKDFSIELISPGGKGKAERATGLFNMLEKGQVFLPTNLVPGASAWIPDLESEWLSWTGHDEETADQIDTASMAANYVLNRYASWGGVLPTGSRLTQVSGGW